MKPIFIILIIMLSGCVNLTPSYSKAEIASGDLARIIPTEHSVGKPEAYVDKVYNSNDLVVADRRYGLNIKKAILLHEGEYTFRLMCLLDGLYAKPILRVVIEKSKLYQVVCTPISGNKDYPYVHDNASGVIGEIKEIATTEKQ
jgi:hypothetical protein